MSSVTDLTSEMGLPVHWLNRFTFRGFNSNITVYLSNNRFDFIAGSQPRFSGSDPWGKGIMGQCSQYCNHQSKEPHFRWGTSGWPVLLQMKNAHWLMVSEFFYGDLNMVESQISEGTTVSLSVQVALQEDSALAHPTRDRAKIPHGRRLPTRGHLLAVVLTILTVFLLNFYFLIKTFWINTLHDHSQASASSHGMLTLDLVAEEDGLSPDYDGDSLNSWESNFHDHLQTEGSCGQVEVHKSWGVGGRQRAETDASKLRVTSKELKVKTGSLPRGSERSWGKHTNLDSTNVHMTQQVKVGRIRSNVLISAIVIIIHFIWHLLHRQHLVIKFIKTEMH